MWPMSSKRCFEEVESMNCTVCIWVLEESMYANFKHTLYDDCMSSELWDRVKRNGN